MDIRSDELRGPRIIALLLEHLDEMHRIPPTPESVHALDLDGLRTGCRYARMRSTRPERRWR